MVDSPVVSRDEWLQARLALLEEEKALTKARDALAEKRRALPRVKLDKDYVFEGASGPVSMHDLFDGRGQLIIYHFMFGPDWEEGCPSCSFWADNYNGTIVHMNHRDVSFALVSRAPIEKLEAYRQRMGWNLSWVSSLSNDFNSDFQVSFSEAEMAAGEVTYNYRKTQFPSSEAPGLSVFLRDGAGDIFHTYSCFSRGLDILNGTYHHLDLVPKGRDEAALDFSMAWLRRRDQYEDTA